MIYIENIIKSKDYQKIALELPQDGIPSYGDENEQFHKIVGFDNYFVSSYGRVVVKKKSGFDRVEPDDHCTRHTITLVKDGVKHRIPLDELVAYEFLIPISGKEKLLHKDGRRKNCRYDNLVFVNEDERRYISESWKFRKNKDDIEKLLNRQKYSQYAQFGFAAIRRIKFNMIHPNGKDTDKVNVFDEWTDEKVGLDDFADWCWQNFYEYPAAKGDELVFDKTILSFGADSIYSSKTCCFAPKYIVDLINDKNDITIGRKTKRGTQYKVPLLDGKGFKTFYKLDDAEKYLYKAKADYLSKVIDSEIDNGYMPINIIKALKKWVDGWKCGLYRSVKKIKNE